MSNVSTLQTNRIMLAYYKQIGASWDSSYENTFFKYDTDRKYDKYRYVES